MPVNEPPDRPLDPEGADWLLLHRYLAGEVSATDRGRVERWMAADPANAALVESLRRITDTSASRRASRFDTAAARSRLERALEREEAVGRHRMVADSRPLRGADIGSAPSRSASSRLPSAPSRMWRSALAAAVTIAAVWTVAQRSKAPKPFREFATRAGQRQSVTLPDGTRFTLAPASRLSLPVDYASGDRAVTLDGEAFFTVAHDAAHPFSVHAGDAVATDIGTAFDVRAYGSDPGVRIAVAEGRVGIGSTTLVAGDVATVAGTAVTVTQGADVRALAAWTGGELVFARTPLADAVADLARWYGIDVQLADPALGRVPLTATFKDEPVADVIDAVASAVGATATWHGHAVVITSVSSRSPLNR